MESVFSKNLNDLSDEFVGAILPDFRLGRRLEMIINRMSQHPDRSFPDLFPTGAELEGAYRFFLNERVNWKDLLEGHRVETVKRCAAFGDVVVAHDTTTFSFLLEDSARQGMGSLSSGSRHTQGFLGHFSFCIGLGSKFSERVPLGVIEVNELTRTGETRPRRNRKIPLTTENESHRWFSQIQKAEESCKFAGKLIHVADREAESYELFDDCLKNKYRFVLRLTEDRNLSEGEFKLFDHLRTASASFQREVHLGNHGIERSLKMAKRHPSREKRLAVVSVAAQELTVKRPSGLGNFVPAALTLNFVRVWEAEPPSGERPVEWLLATTEPIGTPEQINRIIDAYRTRWMIEEYFKALKTGCSIENRQHEKLSTILNILAVCIPVACHLLTLRTLASQSPELPSKNLISPIQMKLLAANFPERADQLRTVQGVLAAIARLGGHLKHSGPPGWLVLARGYRKLLDWEVGAQLYISRPDAICDQR